MEPTTIFLHLPCFFLHYFFSFTVEVLKRLFSSSTNLATLLENEWTLQWMDLSNKYTGKLG